MMRGAVPEIFNALFSETGYFEDASEFGVEWQIIDGKPEFEAFSEALNYERFDFFIFPLHLIPLNRKKEIKIWALAKRTLPGYDIISHNSFEADNIIKVPENQVIKYADSLIGQKCSTIFQSNRFEQMDEIDLLQSILDGETDFAILPAFYKKVLPSSFNIFHLNEREFVHQPGQGCWAVVGHRENTNGKLLRSLHHRETGFLSNLERKVQGSLQRTVHVFAEKNDVGYHMWTQMLQKNEIIEAQISQSTRNELADRLVSKLDF